MDDKLNRKKASTLEAAADMLEKSAARITELEGQVDAVKVENARLRLGIAAAQRANRSEDLARLMYKKSMIGKHEIAEKAKEIMNYDDNAFNILKETVEKTKTPDNNPMIISDDPEPIGKEAYDRSTASKAKTHDALMKV